MDALKSRHALLLACVACGSPHSAGSDAAADTGPVASFCGAHASDLFCDDFDDPSEVDPWTRWTEHVLTGTPVPSLTFGSGVAGRSAEAATTASNSTAAIAKQLVVSTLAGCELDVRLVSMAANTNLVTLTGMTFSDFALATDASGATFVISGASGSSASLGPADGSWHHFAVTLSGGNAAVSEDGAAYTGVVPFAVNPTPIFAVGVWSVVTSGGRADFDNVQIY